MSALIVLTIGPVQSYISQARRTQDLWQGSRILSYLASKGVHHAQGEQDKGLAEVIYPSIDRHNTDNIPNRVVVRWLGDENGAQTCAKEMEKAIRGAWQEISQNTLKYFLGAASSTRIEQIWNRQERNWLECYWVVVPEESQDYSKNIQRANNAMGSRKLLRNFYHIEEYGRKDSITGEHEALHSDGDYVKFWETRQAEERNLALLGKHERLSAISTIKRFAHEKAAGNKALEFPNRFPSTSSIATASFRYDVLHALDNNELDTIQLHQKLEAFVQALLELFKTPADLFFSEHGKPNPEYFGLIEKEISQSTLDDLLIKQFRSIDGDFLFEDTLISKTIEEYSGQTPNPHQMSHVKQALSQLIEAASAIKIPRPNPYFAILAMDGDNMGKTLSILKKDQHKLFSETLARFARENVTRIVEQEHMGRVVYAGGDDVLALLPIRDALNVAEKLRSEFEKTISAIGINNHEGKAVTASTGLAYIHHTHNLQDGVRAANSAQKAAKDLYGRNAIAIEFLRRSGEPRSMGHKWQTSSKNPTKNYINDLIKAFGDKLSRNLPQDIAEIAYSMGDIVPPAAVRLELERIIRRRLSIEDKSTRHIQANKLSEAIWALKDEYTWDNVQCWLELAKFISQTNQGEGDQTNDMA